MQLLTRRLGQIGGLLWTWQGGSDDPNALGAEAAEAFNTGRYDTALKTLERLRRVSQNDEDPKIASNIEVAQYYARGSTNPNQLLNALSAIRCDRLTVLLLLSCARSEISGPPAFDQGGRV